MLYTFAMPWPDATWLSDDAIRVGATIRVNRELVTGTGTIVKDDLRVSLGGHP